MSRVRPPRLAHGEPLQPRTAIGVAPEGESLKLMFGGLGCGHIEIVSLADAEALGERLLDWVEFQRFQQTFPKRAAE